ncbi:hypothetical protein QN277_017669 [Acacia crassicarpa]|uniref:Uncharacterized protein n=1 Tax=Acacia crassicarpa TaxID=499986 RepID=A0AAE1JPI9_9FABA|nr:hypothetical protein QN277_017669 [Acacia crassicarpa]
MDQPQTLNTDSQRLLPLLEALQEAAKNLRANSIPFLFKNDSKIAIEAILEIESKSLAVFSANPDLRKLSALLRSLRALNEKLQKFEGFGLRSLLNRQIIHYKISRVAYDVESEIQSYVDRLTIRGLVKTLVEESASEDDKVKDLIGFEKRLSRGFDIDFQDLVLKAKVFNILEHILCDPLCSKRVRERAAMAIAALVRFNKNVFVGLVLMGPTIKALIALASRCSIQVLTSLISFIRSPLVDELLAIGEIPRIINLLCSDDLLVQVAALDCVLELAYIGRDEVIEAMLKEDLIKKLMDLQRMDWLDDDKETAVCIGTVSESEVKDFPFASCVARFAVQLEVGEGLIKEEKEEFKSQILKMVKEAAQSDAEVATIIAEVLWGSSP